MLFWENGILKSHLQIKLMRERSRFDMVEFGEQLRRAREEKGMTQQSLAEQLYVTRQSVSRWECGDRYPDLLTTKKISQILEVSLDDLLSGKEMTKVVERNPVIEKKIPNNIMIALYAFVVLSFFITIMDIIVRYPSVKIDNSDIKFIAVSICGMLIQIVFFSYGLFQAIRGDLSPKRMGVVVVAFFVAMCIANFENFSRIQLVIVGIFTIAPNLIGAISSYFYFICNRNIKVLSCLISITSILGIVRILAYNYQIISSSRQFFSLNHILRFVLEMAIYGLILYQTYTLAKKRKNAKEISEKK